MSSILAKNIRCYAALKGVSMSKLERQAKLTPGTINNILLGRSKNPSWETVSGLASALNCRPEELAAKEIFFDSLGGNHNPQPLGKPAIVDSRLAKDAAKKITEYCLEMEINPPSKELFSAIQDAYDHAIANSITIIDEKFVKWIVETKLALSSI